MRDRATVFSAHTGDFGNFTSRRATAVYYLWRYITFTDLIITTLIMNDFLVTQLTEYYCNINECAAEMMLVAYIANVVLLIAARMHIERGR